jgi:hypothetical protein
MSKFGLLLCCSMMLTVAHGAVQRFLSGESAPPGCALNGDSVVCTSPVLHASAFPGRTAGEKIATCVKSLPAMGGICDARDLPSGGTIPAITLAKSGIRLVGPCGLFTVTGTIAFHSPGKSLSGVTWSGCSTSYDRVGTHLIWRGNATDPMIDLKGVRDSQFEAISIQSDSAAPLAEAVRLETAQGAISTRRIFKNIMVNGTRQGGLIKGFRWCTGFDCGNSILLGNNDLDYLENVQVANYTNCAFSIEGAQSKTHTFFNSSFGGQSYSQRGVCTTQGAHPSTNAGSFRWYGGGGGGNAVADFDLGAPTDLIVIEACNLESSNRLLQTSGPGSAQWPISIKGCRWAANNLNADNNVVFYQFRGPLILEGNIIELPTGFMRRPKFTISTSGSPSSAVGIGNSVQWTVADKSSNPFAGGTEVTWAKIGNLVRDASNVGYPVANFVP